MRTRVSCKATILLSNQQITVEYLIWVIPFLLAIYSIRAFTRAFSEHKTPTCASCSSTNINANMFKKYGACKDCGHKWKILKLDSAGDGGGGG